MQNDESGEIKKWKLGIFDINNAKYVNINVKINKMFS